ncbi:MAG: hypothetical protein ACLSVD_09345 [Eggerthellaceae bacterium]
MARDFVEDSNDVETAASAVIGLLEQRPSSWSLMWRHHAPSPCRCAISTGWRNVWRRET